MITIRNEHPDEQRIVEELIKKAFWNVNVPGCDEHYLAHTMRSHEDFIPELDLVLELDGKIIASIMYAKSWLIDENGVKKEILTFGPLSVLPEYQRQGYGKHLLDYSLEKAAEMGYDAAVIFGNPENYIARGFKSCKRFNISINGRFPVALLVKELRGGALKGKNWTFEESTAYKYDMSEFEEFDKTFPQMKKENKPSQELFYIYSGEIR